MTNNKQSSIESLLDKIQLSQTTFTDSDGNKYIFLYPILNINDIEQCKEMHKQEMIEFANDLLAQNDINYIAVPQKTQVFLVLFMLSILPNSTHAKFGYKTNQYQIPTSVG